MFDLFYKYPLKAMHDKGDKPCHKVAFYYETPTIMRLESAKAIFPDGTRPVECSMMYCGSCRKTIGPRELTLVQRAQT